MAQSCIEHAWMTYRYLKNKERKTAIDKLCTIINDCKLLNNPLLSNIEKYKLKLITKSLYSYIYVCVIEKFINNIICYLKRV